MTKEQLTATMNTVVAIGQAIRELKTVPSGHLYAQLCGKLSLDEYNQVISLLKRAGLVRESCFELTWIGPNAG